MITLKKIHEMIEKSQNPLIFFDDDPDGLCSYLLIKKHFKKGHPVIVKSSPKLDDSYLKKVDEYSPDIVIILDKPMLSQDFIDGVSVPIIYIDHHPINDIKGVHYYNPLFKDKKDNRPVTYWCYKLTKENLWIATIGTAADYSLATIKEFNKKFPDLSNYNNPGDVIYKTKLGKLIRIFWFNIKHPHYKSLQYVNLLEKINSPYELLNQTTDNSKEVIRIYEKVNKEYKKLLKEALKPQESKIHLFIYDHGKMSFTAELASELQYNFKDKLIIVGRKKNNLMKMSLRYQKSNLHEILQKVMEGLDGRGGGHEHACGAHIDVRDFKEFLERLESYIK